MPKKQFFTRALFSPLIGIYLGFSALDRYFRRKFAKNFVSPPTPLLILGSLKAGGSGKTSVCIELANQLTKRNLKVAILCNWLKGSIFHKKTAQVLKPSWRDYSDEAVLCYKKATSDVYVSTDRVSAWKYISSLKKYDVILSDDGFQDLRLKGAVYILLDKLSHNPNFWDLLPLGNYRETCSARRRAQMLLPEPETNNLRQSLPLWREALNLKAKTSPFIGIFTQGDKAKISRELKGGGIHLKKIFFLKNHGPISLKRLRALKQKYPGVPFLITEKESIKWPNSPDFSNYKILQQKIQFSEDLLDSILNLTQGISKLEKRKK